MSEKSTADEPIDLDIWAKSLLSRCSMCGEWKPPDEFYKNRRMSDGLASRCIPCSKVYFAQWKKEHPERIRESWERCRKKNLQKRKGYNKRWQRANPDKVSAIGSRRRAAKRGLPCDWTSQDRQAMEEYWHGECVYCGSPYEHADHYVPLKSPECPGTVPWNMVPACSKCNCSKNSSEPRTWIRRKFGEQAEDIIRRIEAYLSQLAPQQGES